MEYKGVAMRVKIIASKPIDDGCSGIEEYIGQEFDTYYDEDENLIAIGTTHGDFILFDGEYEVIE